MKPLDARFRDTLLAVRGRFGFEADIDRIIPFVALGRGDAEDILIDHGQAHDFRSALLDRVQETARNYATCRKTGRKRAATLRGIDFLDEVVRRQGRDCDLIETGSGVRLELAKRVW